MEEYFFPCWPWRAYNANAGQFLAEAYFRATGSDHTGVDINANTGGNSDLGHKVRNITKGVVVDARWFPVWGYIVLVYHPGPNVWSQYAHLNQIFVQKGQELAGGQLLGTIGRGDANRYYAHLHFEIRTTLLPANHWPSAVIKDRIIARKFISKNYVDGIRFLLKNNAKVI